MCVRLCIKRRSGEKVTPDTSSWAWALPTHPHNTPEHVCVCVCVFVHTGEKDQLGDRALTPQVCVKVRRYISNPTRNVLVLETSSSFLPGTGKRQTRASVAVSVKCVRLQMIERESEQKIVWEMIARKVKWAFAYNFLWDGMRTRCL